MISHLREYSASRIGATAYASWPRAQAAAIIGQSSRGLFLRPTPDRVFFLSYESERGPLTITLPASLRELFAQHTLTPGTIVRFLANRLIVPAIKVAIAVSAEIVWQAPRPVAPICSSEAIRLTLRAVVQALPSERRREGFGPLLSPLLDRTPPPDENIALYDHLSSLSALCARRSPQAAESAIELLGYGRGLTPSGDDAVVGLLLLLNRFPRMNSRADTVNMLKQVQWLAEFNRQIIRAAYQRTTTLSANLIECAAHGEADERLIAVADGLVTGQPPTAECVESVLGWGSSSGIDALAGMALILTAL